MRIETMTATITEPNELDFSPLDPIHNQTPATAVA
jgi:hypothetical protein